MKVVIIGNGVAGNTAASTIRQLSPSAQITIVSDEVHPHYSACALPQYLAGEIKKRGLFIRTKADYRKEKIKIAFGQKVVSLDLANQKVVLETGSLDYDRLIMATGGRPFMPPVEGIKLAGVHSFKWLDDAVQIRNSLPRTAVVVGTGPIGIEAGIALNKKDAKVYFIELLERVMPRLFDNSPANLVRGILEKHGIEVFTGERVTRIAGNDRVEGIVTDKRLIACEMVVMAAGMRANTDLAKQAGLAIGKTGGITVNNRMETSHSGVYACGDCAETEDLVTGNPSLIQLWHNAKGQGEVAGSNAAGVGKIYSGSINITSLNVFDTHAVSFGSIEADVRQSRQVGIEVIEKAHGEENYHRLITEKGRLVGAQFIGDARDMGAVLYALIRKEQLPDLKQFGNGRPTLAILLRDYHLAPYLALKKTLQRV